MVSVIKAMNTSNHNANIPVGQLKAGYKTNFIPSYQNTLWPAVICVNPGTPFTY